MCKRYVGVLLALALVSTAWAQQERPRAPRGERLERDLEFEIVPVSQLDLEETAALIGKLEPRVQVRWSESIHALVLRGEKQYLKDIVTLVDRMEKMASTEATEQTRVFKLHNRRWGDIEEHLLVMAGHVCMAGDEATRQVIVRGTPEEIELVEELLRQLDQPQQTVELTFDFLRVEYSNEGDAPSGVDIPKRLDGVWKALKQSGARSASLLTSAVVRCAEAEEFATRGVQTDRDAEMHFSLKGEISLMEEAGMIGMTVLSEVTRKVTNGDQRGRHTHEFGIETSLAAKTGEAVVLASYADAEIRERLNGLRKIKSPNVAKTIVTR